MTTISLRRVIAAGGARMPASAGGSLRRWALDLVAGWTPTSELARLVYAAGFRYDPLQDIIYSRMDAWQHDFGYCYAFDKYALATSFVIDCEPIFFHHAGKRWMIELWKGQYGLETGCEIGLYNRRDDDNGPDMQALDATIGRREDGRGGTDAEHSLFYKCAGPAEHLQMSLRLRRGDEVVLERGPEMHWWLTGFRWGELSRPESLAMDVRIAFADDALRDAFVAALHRTGYADVRVTGAAVDFVFDVPCTHQPRVDGGAMQDTVMASNGLLVQAYRALAVPRSDPNLLQGQLGARVAELTDALLGKSRDFYVASLPGILEQVAEDTAERVKDFFGIP